MLLEISPKDQPAERLAKELRQTRLTVERLECEKKELENKNILVKPERKFFYFGIISCIFLILHASFLGVDLESELFQKFRRVVIVTFILFGLERISLHIVSLHIQL